MTFLLKDRASNDSVDLASYCKMPTIQEAVELHALDTMLQERRCSKSQGAIAEQIAIMMPSSRWKFASVVNPLRSLCTMFVVNRGAWRSTSAMQLFFCKQGSYQMHLEFAILLHQPQYIYHHA